MRLAGLLVLCAFGLSCDRSAETTDATALPEQAPPAEIAPAAENHDSGGLVLSPALAGRFEAALKSDFSKRIFKVRPKSLTLDSRGWMPSEGPERLAVVKIEGFTCHADGFHHEFLGVVDPDTNDLLSGVHHVHGDSAVKRPLWGKRQLHMLVITEAGNHGYVACYATLVTFTPGGVRVRDALRTEESREVRIETTAKGDVLLKVHRKDWGPVKVMETLRWDQSKAEFVGGP